jgi:hypothetical protein
MHCPSDLVSTRTLNRRGALLCRSEFQYLRIATASFSRSRSPPPPAARLPRPSFLWAFAEQKRVSTVPHCRVSPNLHTPRATNPSAAVLREVGRIWNADVARTNAQKIMASQPVAFPLIFRRARFFVNRESRNTTALPSTLRCILLCLDPPTSVSARAERGISGLKEAWNSGRFFVPEILRRAQDAAARGSGENRCVPHCHVFRKPRMRGPAVRVVRIDRAHLHHISGNGRGDRYGRGSQQGTGNSLVTDA